MLSRQGEELSIYQRRLGEKVRVLADWPRSNPGYYRLRLEYQGEVEEQTITVWPQRISREAFAQMLEDLDTRLPTSVAIGLQRTGALTGLKLPRLGEITLAQELVRLRRAVNGTEERPGLTEILCKLACEPYQILKTNEIWVLQERARRPSSSGLVQAFCRGHNLDASGRPIRLPDILLKRPPYHAALKGYLEFIRSPAVRLEEFDLDAPLEKLPHLYQVWSTLLIIETLLEVAGQKGYQVDKQCLVARDKSGVYIRILPNGQPAIVLSHPQHKTRVKLITERTYGKHGELRSASVKQRPDVAVEVKLHDDSQQVYLFDPKYKLENEVPDNVSDEGKSKAADIQKMHTYHDAIQDSQGIQVVQYAAILYPGSYESYSNGELEALPAYPGTEVKLKQHLHRVLVKALEVF